LIAKEMPIHIWWKSNGFELSNLQKFAIKGLNQVIVVLTWIYIYEIIESTNIILK
jgi:hypothetical protein